MLGKKRNTERIVGTAESEQNLRKKRPEKLNWRAFPNIRISSVLCFLRQFRSKPKKPEFIDARKI